MKLKDKYNKVLKEYIDFIESNMENENLIENDNVRECVSNYNEVIKNYIKGLKHLEPSQIIFISEMPLLQTWKTCTNLKSINITKDINLLIDRIENSMKGHMDYVTTLVGIADEMNR